MQVLLRAERTWGFGKVHRASSLRFAWLDDAVLGQVSAVYRPQPCTPLSLYHPGIGEVDLIRLYLPRIDEARVADSPGCYEPVTAVAGALKAMGYKGSVAYLHCEAPWQ